VQVISTPAVFNDEVRLRSRFSYDCILTKASWNSLLLLSHITIDEMTFWLDNIEKLNEKGADLCHLTNIMMENVDIYCDASEVGFGVIRQSIQKVNHLIQQENQLI